MSNLILYFPVDNVRNQGFGENPDYYSKFHDQFGNPLKGHDGIDFRAPHGTPVYAALDGMIHFERDSHGGEGMSIHATQLFDNIKGYPIAMNWHLIGDTEPDKYPSPIPTDGKSYPIRAGELIGYADNTGAPYESSGDHLHFGLFCVDEHENTLDMGNGFNGRIDPSPFFSNIEAKNVLSLTSKLQKLIPILKKLVEYYESIITK